MRKSDEKETICTNCGAALDFDPRGIIDVDYVKCQYCGTLNLVKITDNSLISVKDMALHTFKEYKVKINKDHKRKNSPLGKLEERRNKTLYLLSLPMIFGSMITIYMIVGLYEATSIKDYIFFTVFLIVLLITIGAFGHQFIKKFKDYNLLINQEKKKK